MTLSAVLCTLVLPALAIRYGEETAHQSTLSSMQVNTSSAEKSRRETKIPSNLSEWFALLDKTLKLAGGEDMEGHSSKEANPQTRLYDTWARSKDVKTICEIGFNAGHSALRFMAQGNATLYEFDMGQHKSSKVAAQFMKNHFGDRFTIVWGDSTKTVPQYTRDNPETKCDVVIVDGGHTVDVATADLVNMEAMAAEKNTVALDDTKCTAWWCEGPTKAWKAALEQGCVKDSTLYSYSFNVGEYTHKNRFGCSFLKLTGYSLRRFTLLLLFPGFAVLACFLYLFFYQHSKVSHALKTTKSLLRMARTMNR